MILDEINLVFASQKEYSKSFKNSSYQERINKLKKFKKVIIKNKQEIADALYLDFRKPAVETDLTEILPILSALNYFESHLNKLMSPTKVKAPLLFKGTSSFILKEGKGVALIISPWNYPFQLALYPFITSFAAGNCSIIKPSEFTPKTNEIIKKLLREVFCEKEVSIFEGGADVSQILLNKPFDHIFFTGSTAVGKIIMEKASLNLASVSLELGGKSPAILDSNLDMYDAVKKILWGKVVNAGQTCVAPDYVLIHKDQEKIFLETCSLVIREFYPQSMQKDFSSIITSRHFERLQKLTEDAKNKGAEVLSFGQDDPSDKYFSFKIIKDATLSMDVMKEEIFGPILPIVTYESLHEAEEMINSFGKALHTYIFTKGDHFSQSIIKNTSSGGVTINDTLIAVSHPELPFGGIGASGIGKYHGEYGFLEFTNLRPILKRELNLGTSYFYPPYTYSKIKLVKKLIERFSRLF